MEKYIDHLYPTCFPFFPDLFTSIEKANPVHSFFVGTTTAICESKLWAKKMVDMYLEGKEFVNGTPRPLATMYRNQKTAPLAANYSGPIPVLTSSRKNHQCDNFLFDDAGGMNCVAVGLETLAQHSLFNNSAVKVLDIRGASEFGCNDTTDGVHYIRGLSLRRQLTLLLRGMQSTSVNSSRRSIVENVAERTDDDNNNNHDST
jgi:hypothetical protein